MGLQSGRTFWRVVFGLILAVWANPALAEKLEFDHRLVPALKAVLDSGDTAMLAYDDSNPRNLTNTIAVRGKSAKDWSEALVIVARTPDRKIRTAAEWRTALETETASKCPSTFATIAQDELTVTFDRQSSGCPAGYPARAIYRVLGTKRSLFLLAVLVKDDLTPPSREQWLAMMASAHIE